MRFAGEALLTQPGPNFGGMSRNGIESRANEKMAAHESEAQVHGAGLRAMAEVAAAKYGAQATMAEGRAAGQMAMFGGLGDAFGSIASGIASRTPAAPSIPAKTFQTTIAQQ